MSLDSNLKTFFKSDNNRLKGSATYKATPEANGIVTTPNAGNQHTEKPSPAPAPPACIEPDANNSPDKSNKYDPVNLLSGFSFYPQPPKPEPSPASSPDYPNKPSASNRAMPTPFIKEPY